MFPQLLILAIATRPGYSQLSQVQQCTSLIHSFQFEDTTVLNATHVPPNATFAVPGSCQSTAQNGPQALCRVQLLTRTTNTSQVHMEAWLPDTWFGRFLGLGNLAFGGCIDYENLPYTTSLHFATISSDNGHDGDTAAPLLGAPEVINDFGFRSVHTEALVGKALVKHYYDKPHSKSYYLGCSTGGRQGIKTATMFPDDFDGIVAGSPAVDMNHIVDYTQFLSLYLGAPITNRSTSPKFIPPSLFPVISQEILNQCDAIDGLVDGIIAEPDECIFRPEAIICSVNATNTSSCLTPTQVNTLRQIYSPLFDENQNLLAPRLDPGAEADGFFTALLSGQFSILAVPWYQFTIFNTTNVDFANFNLTDVAIGDDINPGGAATFDGELGAFHARGGKLLTYHGRRDQLIGSGNSKRLYNLISQVLQMPSLDSFYRLFLIPGMGHCLDGQGAWAFGQRGLASAIHNDTSHNILLSLVDWVENGIAPATITGSIPGDSTADRVHCRYPQKTFWTGEKWTCVI